MGPEITAPTNFITEQLLSGNVTLNLVGICFTVASIAVGITLWAVYKFQTKSDAKDMDSRWLANLKMDSDSHKRSLEEAKSNFKMAFDGLHDHMTTMKADTKTELRQVQTDIGQIRNVMNQVGSDVSFLRGKAESSNVRGLK